MFHKNTAHQQHDLFGVENQLSPSKRKKLKKSKEYTFYELVFCTIDEELFAPLFSGTGSRPNAPVNTLVAALILQSHNDWTCEELFNHIDFDILTRTALGLNSLDETPFCRATYFNFRNRLSTYYAREGRNLLEEVFDGLTKKQIRTLKVRTSIQRMDSFQAMSHIRSYSRVQLLIEMLLRLYRVLCDSDKQRFCAHFAPYTKHSSQNYVYTLSRESIPHELEKLGQVYHHLYTALKDTYGDHEIFRAFARVYTEHFTTSADTVTVKESSEIATDSLQSPDDLDATYRFKNGRGYKGQAITITETAHPANQVNLLTDVAVTPNNVDDSTVLQDRIETLKEKTPELEELHTDGAYGSSDNDEKMEEAQITHVQTAVRGRQAAVHVTIEKDEGSTTGYRVRCPQQRVRAYRGRKNYCVCFDGQVCTQCTYRNQCPTRIKKNGDRVYYFTDEDARYHTRVHAWEQLPDNRKKLRPNVEASVKEFCKGYTHKGKLRVRGRFKTMLYAVTMAIGINFGRIYRCLQSTSPDPAAIQKKRRAHCTRLADIWGRLRRFVWQSIPNVKERTVKTTVCVLYEQFAF